MKTLAPPAFAGLAVLLACAAPAFALPGQPVPNAPYIHKTQVQESPFPGGGNHTVTVRTVVDPGKMVALHLHPGLEMAYVVSGDAKVKIGSAPERSLKEGDSFSVPPRVPHSVVNSGGDPLTIVSTYVVDPREPIAQVAK